VSKAPSDKKVLLFVVLLCGVCGFLLAVFAYGLQRPQKEAKEFDESKQMLIAAKILKEDGTFQLLTEKGATPAAFDPSTKTLIPSEISTKATKEEVKEIALLRIRPLLTTKEGSVFSLEEKNITLSAYLSENKKAGYAELPLKLFYAILPNDPEVYGLAASDVAKQLNKVEMVIIPVSGFGLWAPIYGFLAISNNGDEVIGTTWYEHAETPGLGANITEPWWQKQFYHKVIFQESPDGSTDFKTANMGIIVVKGKVRDVFGTTPRAKSAVDGMSGATLTGDGVTQAYRNSLTPYRAFFIKLRSEEKKNGP